MPDEDKPKKSNDLPVTNTPLFASGEKIAKVNVAEEIKNSFLDYSMSVIISRALPDARDGLETLATPHSAGDARSLAVSEPPASQVRQNLRRHQRQLPSARRSGDLSDARPHGAAVGHARTARGRPGQLRFRRRRSARRHALHRGAHDASRRRADGGHGPGHGGFRPQLRRNPHRADRFPRRVSESARQRRHGHRRRHGHEHCAAQPRRNR